jgi:hypothetical protein
MLWRNSAILFLVIVFSFFSVCHCLSCFQLFSSKINFADMLVMTKDLFFIIEILLSNVCYQKALFKCNAMKI